jgi:hypothetical protein
VILKCIVNRENLVTYQFMASTVSLKDIASSKSSKVEAKLLFCVCM